MKNVLFLLLFIVVSCTTETPGRYEYDGSISESSVITNINESLNIVDETKENYIEISSLVVSNNKSGLSNTIWKLTKMRKGTYSSTIPNDIINFINDSEYLLNDSKIIRKYFVTSNFSGLEIRLYDFTPFGGGYYSGLIYQQAINDGQFNNVLFKNLLNENDDEIVATFIKQK